MSSIMVHPSTRDLNDGMKPKSPGTWPMAFFYTDGNENGIAVKRGQNEREDTRPHTHILRTRAWMHTWGLLTVVMLVRLLQSFSESLGNDANAPEKSLALCNNRDGTRVPYKVSSVESVSVF